MNKHKYQKPSVEVTYCNIEHSIAAGSVSMKFHTEFEDQVDMVQYEKQELGAQDVWF